MIELIGRRCRWEGNLTRWYRIVDQDEEAKQVCLRTITDMYRPMFWVPIEDVRVDW